MRLQHCVSETSKIDSLAIPGLVKSSDSSIQTLPFPSFLLSLGLTLFSVLHSACVSCEKQFKEQFKSSILYYSTNGINLDIKTQQKFYSLPKRYKQIRRFEQRPFVGPTPIPDEGPLLETSNLLYRLGSE